MTADLPSTKASDSRRAIPVIAPQRDAEARLRRGGYLALHDVSCEQHGEVLYLRGCLPSYFLKQMAQAIVAEVEGVGEIVNRIEVVGSPSRPSAEAESSVRPVDSAKTTNN